MSRLDRAFTFFPASEIETLSPYAFIEFALRLRLFRTFRESHLRKVHSRKGYSRKGYSLALCALLILYTLSIISFFHAAYASPPPPPQSTKARLSGATETSQALELLARTSQFGIARYLISKDAVSVITFTGSTVWRKNMPDKVIMVRPENKIFLETTRKDWINWARRGIDLVKIKHVEKVGVENLCGRTVEHYKAFETEVPIKSKPSAEFWTIPGNSFNDAVLKYWCDMLDLPTKYGFPIKVKQRHEGQFVTMVNPTSLKIVTSKTSDFAAPAGYRKARDLAAFYFSESGDELQSSDLTDLFMYEKRGGNRDLVKPVGEKDK